MTPGPRSLGYWLDAGHPEPSDAMSEQTVLQSMAFRWVVRRIRMISFWAVAAAFAAMSVVTSFVGNGISPGPWAVLAACYAVVGIACTVYHRMRPVPPSWIFDRRIWISTTRRGIVAAVVMSSVMLLVWILPLLNGGADTNRWGLSIAGVGVVALSTVFIVQGWHYQHASRLFRHHIEKNERARTVLEDMVLNPPVSARTAERFGPL